MFLPCERPFRLRGRDAANPLGHGCVAPEGTPLKRTAACGGVRLRGEGLALGYLIN